MPKILYIDLSDGFEDLSIEPNRYGGGQIVPSFCREKLDDFYTAGHENCFSNINLTMGFWEKWDKCLLLPNNATQKLRNGEKLESFIDTSKYDLIFHSASNVFLNTDKPQCVWTVGYSETIHPKHSHILSHSPAYQNFKTENKDAKIHKIVIGKPVPPFQYYDKKEQIFQCTNHAPCFSSIELAQICVRNKIRLILGGPISEGYPLLNYIDNNYVTYVGVLDYKTKIDYTKESLAHTLLHKHPINWTLSGLEALAYGCRLITSTAGFWPSFINKNIGRMVTSEDQFLRAFDEIHHIDQRYCWETANKYNSDVMVESCRSAFEQILNK